MAWDRLVSVDEGRRLLAGITVPVVGDEMVDLVLAAGRVTAVDIAARDDVPGFFRSRVDGYAVRAADTYGASEQLPAYLDICGSVAMGEAADREIGPGQAVTVPTGGMMPPGSDAAVMIEHTVRSGSALSVLRSAAPGEHVTRAGEDLARGEMIVPAGTRLSPALIGALAAAGVVTVPVRRRPRVIVLSTGDEVVDPDQTPGPGQVRDINGQALIAAVRRDGADGEWRGIVPDQDGALLTALASAVLDADMVLLSGGSSVGVRDLASDAIERLGPPGVLAHGLMMKPGKPTIIASAKGTPVLGLPGHPVSAMVVYEVVVRPALMRLCGSDDGGRLVMARLDENVGSAVGREDYLRVRLGWRDGELWADPVPGHSALIRGLARADGLAVVPAAVSGYDRGTMVTVLLTDV